ncbi:MAG: sensor histidine kinase [Halobacteriales archaeon]
MALKDRLKPFAGIVSHDLRNPLQLARGRLTLAREGIDNEQLDEVATAHEWMATLIDEQLTLGRINDGIEALEPVDLADPTNSSWHQVGTANASLDLRIEQMIQADRGRLQQLLENLFTDAIEHGGDDVTGTVGELRDGFYVAADGAGIPADDLDQVFDAGFSTSAEGTGLGLNTVSEIIDVLGWSVRITDSAGGGSRFEITAVQAVDR